MALKFKKPEIRSTFGDTFRRGEPWLCECGRYTYDAGPVLCGVCICQVEEDVRVILAFERVRRTLWSKYG